jgi:hypothetical protein
MRTFTLVRDKDLSGVSGTGTVAEGIEFDTGKVAICWLTKYHSVSVFDSLHVLEQVHGHEGSTKVQWTTRNIGEVW